MHERIKELRQLKKLSQAAFGERIGVKRNTVATYEIGRNVPINAVVSAICREFNVNEDWLRNGNGPMFVESATFDLGAFIRQRGASDLEEEILKAYFELDVSIRRSLLEHFRSYFSHLPEGTQGGSEDVTEAIPELVYFMVPWFYLPMSAGTGEEAGNEQPDDLRLMKAPPKGTSYVAPVSGDSMEPTYHDGDKLFIQSREEILPGQIGVFFMDGKQWVKELGDGVLISHNSEKYDPIPMREDIKCQGLVLGVCDKSYFE